MLGQCRPAEPGRNRGKVFSRGTRCMPVDERCGKPESEGNFAHRPCFALPIDYAAATSTATTVQTRGTPSWPK